jgi:hypothetical protein
MAEELTLTREEIEKLLAIKPCGDVPMLSPREFSRLCHMALAYLDSRDVKADAPVDGNRLKCDWWACPKQDNPPKKVREGTPCDNYNWAAGTESPCTGFVRNSRAAIPEPKAMRDAQFWAVDITKTFFPNVGVEETIKVIKKIQADALQSKGCALPEGRWIKASLTPDEFYGEGSTFAGYLLVFTPNKFQKVHVAYWNCDLPFNGQPTGWEGFHAWENITHWQPLPAAPKPPKE